MHPSLGEISHRPWPLPKGPWIMRQEWLDLLFAHWPVSADVLRPWIPEELEIEEFAGSSWIGIVPFRMADVMLRGLPGLPWISAFPELNVRVYVRHHDKPGVWFLSLDAPRFLATIGARIWFHLPYHWSRVTHQAASMGSPHPFHATAQCARAKPPLVFDSHYGPDGKTFQAKPGTLEYFLTERYRLYARNGSGKLLYADVHHAPWPLQPGCGEVHGEDMLRPFGIRLPNQPPHLLFSKGVKVTVWALKPVD